MVHAIEKFHVIPWLMIEFGFCALWSFFFFTAALAFAVKVSHIISNLIESSSGMITRQIESSISPYSYYVRALMD